MATHDPYIFLKTLIAKDEAEAYARVSKVQAPLVVTLSRDYGAGGEMVAQKLAEYLGIPVYDREILDRVARKAKIDTFKLESHDESVSAGVSTFLYSVLTGTAGDMRTYRRALYEVVAELAQKDCLLVGRGAHLILSGKKVFRVRIVGSKVVCAKRVAEESGLPLPEAERKVYEVNNKRHKSILNLYSDSFEHCSLEYAKNFDLVINTDHISAENAVPVILLGMRQAGFDLRNATAKS
jgi:cytidylate kinase